MEFPEFVRLMAKLRGFEGSDSGGEYAAAMAEEEDRIRLETEEAARAQHAKEHKAALFIQKGYRGSHARIFVSQLREEIRRDRAARTIQRHSRGKLGRKRVERLLEEREAARLAAIPRCANCGAEAPKGMTICDDCDRARKRNLEDPMHNPEDWIRVRRNRLVSEAAAKLNIPNEPLLREANGAPLSLGGPGRGLLGMWDAHGSPRSTGSSQRGSSLSPQGISGSLSPRSNTCADGHYTTESRFSFAASVAAPSLPSAGERLRQRPSMPHHTTALQRSSMASMKSSRAEHDYVPPVHYHEDSILGPSMEFAERNFSFGGSSPSRQTADPWAPQWHAFGQERPEEFAIWRLCELVDGAPVGCLCWAGRQLMDDGRVRLRGPPSANSSSHGLDNVHRLVQTVATDHFDLIHADGICYGSGLKAIDFMRSWKTAYLIAWERGLRQNYMVRRLCQRTSQIILEGVVDGASWFRTSFVILYSGLHTEDRPDSKFFRNTAGGLQDTRRIDHIGQQHQELAHAAAGIARMQRITAPWQKEKRVETKDIEEERNMWQGECEKLEEQVDFLKQSLLDAGHDNYRNHTPVPYLPADHRTMPRGYRREGVRHSNPPLPSWQGEPIPRRSPQEGRGLPLDLMAHG
eukprot:TRINITY_DN13551_c0_g1_i1.p1 TRINITY_DN13551_c0_g1~~TRINITY_DN13551_c0_g1_i1.p1  ORF type:complete len:740 (+),score=146.86 TRINITY_DN13551_c0_g1_i1:322-2220(+)